jgi:predicted  nucleic acid-binding Zn-ribbon protein
MSQMQRPGQYDPTHRGAGSAEPPDPSERLRQLKNELDQHNSRITHLTAQATALQTDITDLSTSVTQVQTAVTSYGTGLPDLQSRLQALQYFYDQKSKMILAAIGEKKEPIDELIREFDYELDRMEDRLAELGEKLALAQAESDEANNLEKLRQNEYDHANQYQQDVTAKLTDMETLRTDITHADDNTDAATMYFLVLEFHGRMRDTHIIPQNQLSTELRHKLAELEAAKEHARARTSALNAIQAEYTAHQTEIQTKRQGRRAALLVEVQKMFPVPPASSTPGGTTTTSGSTSGAGASSGSGTASTAASSGATTPAPAAGTSSASSTSAGTAGAASPSTTSPAPPAEK